jgi:hypothetical protein
MIIMRSSGFQWETWVNNFIEETEKYCIYSPMAALIKSIQLLIEMSVEEKYEQ